MNKTLTTITYPCDREGVLKLIPHRDPFVWVSRIVACDPACSIVAEFDVDSSLPLFAGHFPGNPVLPGVLIMEALAQASCCYIMASPRYAGCLGLFAAMDNVKFRRQVLPGETLRLESTLVKCGSRMCVADVVASVDGIVCAQATQRYVIDSGGSSRHADASGREG